MTATTTSVLDIIRCPITHQIFKDPVFCSDGHTYERQAIEFWIKTNGMSPFNRTISLKIYDRNRLIANLVDTKLDKYPALSCEQYVPTTYLSLQDIHYLEDEKILEILENGNYQVESFLNGRKLIHELALSSKIQSLSYLIDYDIDLDSSDDDGIKLVHIVCRVGLLEVLNYLIEKGVDLEVSDNFGSKPIHNACMHSVPLEIIKCLADNGVDLESTAVDGCRPIHWACSYSKIETVEYLIEKGVDLECKTDFGWRPIHMACGELKLETIKLLVENGVDLEASNKQGVRPIHAACISAKRYLFHQLEEVIRYLVEKGVELECYTNFGSTPYSMLSFEYEFYENEVLLNLLNLIDSRTRYT